MFRGSRKAVDLRSCSTGLKLLVVEDVASEALRERDPKKACRPKLHGALLKNEQDVHLFERLALWRGGRSDRRRLCPLQSLASCAS